MSPDWTAPCAAASIGLEVNPPASRPAFAPGGRVSALPATQAMMNPMAVTNRASAK